MLISEEHYLELLDIALNECRKKFDSGKVWEMEEALCTTKRLDIYKMREEDVKLMESELQDKNREWWDNYQERKHQLT